LCPNLEPRRRTPTLEKEERGSKINASVIRKKKKGAIYVYVTKAGRNHEVLGEQKKKTWGAFGIEKIR